MKLDVSNLACERGGYHVFEHVSFALDAGDMLMLTGPNGVGKSSLLRLLAGLGEPVAGTIVVDGRNVAGDPARFAVNRIYVGHADALKPSLTVAENLMFWTRLQRGTNEVAEAVASALETLGLGSLADTPARYLSAGQRRRAALARAMASGAPLWLLDEPTTALDSRSLAALDDIIARHLAGGGLAVVSSHVAVKGATASLELGATA